MKKNVVTSSRPSNQVLTSEANPSKYYGVAIFAKRPEGERGFITCRDYQKNFVVRGAYDLTVGNSWTYGSGTTLTTFIESLIEKESAVFQFDTAKELFAWLTEHN